MKLVLVLIFSVFGVLCSHSQKETLETIDAQNITSLQIESNEVFRITISTSKNGVIGIKTQAEGEYLQNLAFITELTGRTLKITSKYPEILTSGFDKLSAHKVFAVEVFLEIPENLNVEINSNTASVFGSGYYKNLQVQLKSGQCHLENFNGNLIVNTFKGDITVETLSAKVEATSRHGSVLNGLKYSGENTIKLKSIDGNISVLESQ